MRDFLRDISSAGSEGLLCVLYGLAKVGIKSSDGALALFALAEAVKVQPGAPQTHLLLQRFEETLYSGRRNTQLGNIYKDILRCEESPVPSWSSILPSLQNCIVYSIRRLKSLLFEDTEY